MCGIAGIYDSNCGHTSDIDPEAVEQMVSAIEHRGPDQQGIFIDGSFGFGARRLSILDLDTGDQPISTQDDSKCICFNGEIYNYLDLRAKLEDLGHNFKTQGDTEVVLHCFEEYGDDCVQHLQGMFAFAVWDKQKRRLFIARDRFGIKPLFYSWHNGTLHFGSELKCFASQLESTLNKASLGHFFSYLYFPRTFTPYNEIHSLLPGHSIVVEGGEMQIARYYSLPATKAIARKRDEDSWLSDFLALAKDVIDRHMLSDVPVGAFLSGGIDSSLVVALMDEVSEEQIRTFSIGYKHGGESFDERGYARQVAELYNTEHHELVLTPKQVQERLPEILERLDAPFGDASVIPNFLLSEYASGHVKVALSGLGGDEVCGGYERHLGALVAERHPVLSSLVSAPVSRALLGMIPDSKKGSHLPERAKRFAASAALPLADRYFSFISKFGDQQKRSLFTDSALNDIKPSASSELFTEIWNESRAWDSPLSKILQADLRSYLVDDLLALSDRTSMAHSLEIRVPFVDHTLVEFFFTVPDELKIKGMSKKYLLKKAAEKYLPDEIIYRRKKGFSVPLSIWFRNELNGYLRDTLSSATLRKTGLFNHSYIEQLLREHEQQVRNHDEKLFGLLSLAVWLESQ